MLLQKLLEEAAVCTVLLSKAHAFDFSCLATPLSGMSCRCLQIDVVDLSPHVNPALGTTHGATWSGAIGWHTRAGYKHKRGYHEACTVYQAS